VLGCTLILRIRQLIDDREKLKGCVFGNSDKLIFKKKQLLKLSFFIILFLCKSEINDADLLAFLFAENLHL